MALVDNKAPLNTLLEGSHNTMVWPGQGCCGIRYGDELALPGVFFIRLLGFLILITPAVR